MKRRKLFWLFGMAALCLVLFTIIDARLENTSSVIMGGAQGAYVTSDTVTFEDPNAEAEPTAEDLLDWPEVDFEDPSNQYRMVRDETNFLLSSAFIPEDLAEIPGYRLSLSSVALPYLEALMDAAREAGFTIYVAGAYRTYGHQNYLFNSKASQIAAGMGIDDYMDPDYQLAVEEARTITAFPGSSEHQLGLAVDLMDRQYSSWVYENMNQEFYAWLDEHCAEYGFIKRYPTKKLLLTGWDEPWHYRFVGKEAATFIMEHDLCYEEFYAHYHPEFTF